MSGWVAGAIAVSSVVGAKTAKSAAKTQAAAASEAANVQKQVADQQVALQREMYQQTRQDQMPFRQGGLEAQNRLMTLLGLGGQTPATGGGGGGGGVVGMVADAVRDSGAVGGGGLNIDPNSPDYGKYARDFGMSDFQADPGYAFRLSEGQKALDRSAAARGGLISGAALKAAGRYGQDMASQEYTNAYNRYQTNRSNQLNPLQSLMGAGQTSTNQLGQAGQNYATGVGGALGSYGTNVGNLMTGAGAAQAAGQVGAANAITGGLGTYLNYSQNNALLNALRTPQGYGTSAGYGP
jgi:hypothetical protein